MVRGAKPNVLRAIAAVGPIVNAETETCGVCGTHELLFYFDQLGRTVERCSNPRCIMNAPHAPVPSLAPLPKAKAPRGLSAMRARAAKAIADKQAAQARSTTPQDN